MRAPILDMDPYPPFDGFPKQGLDFFEKLKRNNNREWFDKHKDDYKAYVKLPMQALVAAMQPHFLRFAPEFEVNPKRSVFRIYRDIRFSKDKTPYKTHTAAHFVLRGKPKGFLGSGYYMHIEPGEAFAGAGLYMPDSDQLKKIRKAISQKAEEFLEIVDDRKFLKVFGKLKGNRLKRVPQGYNEVDPMVNWLKLKQFFVGVSWPDSSCRREDFVEKASAVFEKATPLVRFLNEAIR